MEIDGKRTLEIDGKIAAVDAARAGDLYGRLGPTHGIPYLTRYSGRAVKV